jgi:hypothetical protein
VAETPHQRAIPSAPVTHEARFGDEDVRLGPTLLPTLANPPNDQLQSRRKPDGGGPLTTASCSRTAPVARVRTSEEERIGTGRVVL